MKNIIIIAGIILVVYLVFIRKKSLVAPYPIIGAGVNDTYVPPRYDEMPPVVRPVPKPVITPAINNGSINNA